MKTVLSAGAFALVMVGGQVDMSKIGPVKVLETMEGSSFLAIESALKTLERWGLDMPDSTITVLREKETPVVVVERVTPASPAVERHGARVDPNAELAVDEVNRLMSTPDAARVQDRIQGGSLPAVRVAAKVFREKIPDLSGYRITLLREGDSLVVTFTDRDARPGARGSGGKRLGFEVEMNAGDLVVRRSNFIR